MRFAPGVAAVAAWAALALAGEPVDDAMEAFRQGEFARALELASSVKVNDPARAKAVYLVGEADLMLERWYDAEKAFLELIETKPDNVAALVGLGRAQVGTRSVDDAIVTLEKAVKLDPKDVAARRCLGDARAVKGDLDAARADLEAAVKLDPKDALSSRALVDTNLRAEKLDLAGKEAERLVKAIPDHPMGHFLRGLVLDRQGRDKDAIEAYEKAVAKDDKFIDAHKNLAILCVARNPGYQDKERTRKALRHFQRYFDLGGKDEELKKLYEQIKGFVGEKQK